MYKSKANFLINKNKVNFSYKKVAGDVVVLNDDNPNVVVNNTTDELTLYVTVPKGEKGAKFLFQFTIENKNLYYKEDWVISRPNRGEPVRVYATTYSGRLKDLKSEDGFVSLIDNHPGYNHCRWVDIKKFIEEYQLTGEELVFDPPIEYDFDDDPGREYCSNVVFVASGKTWEEYLGKMTCECKNCLNNQFN
jgi:hypothetical protein